MKTTLRIAILKSPLWLLELLTGAKSFRDNPLLGSSRLNKAGLHVIRIIAAHLVMRCRMGLLGWNVAPEDRRSYQQNGYILKENYLSEADFALLEQEIRTCEHPPRRSIQGDTETQRTLLSPTALEDLPQTTALLSDQNFRRLLRYCNGHSRLPFFNIECILNGANDSTDYDPQKDLHTDTFHPTMKFWLYLDDVDENNGPFTYVPGSNRLTRQRIKWEYRMSQQARDHPNRLVGRGSFRFSEHDRKTLGLPAPKAFHVKKNTLLIANTFGIHGRGGANDGSQRLSLWGMGRTNPFLPFTGIGLESVNRLQYQVLEWIEARNKR